jgi:NTP pyrophosphatase (non-canonical NTP hydrolase)
MDATDLSTLRSRVKAFAAERNWERFHDPKNLVMALTSEVGELTELFQWLTPQEGVEAMRDPKRGEAIRDEMADVLYYVLRLSDVLDVDLERALSEKLEKNKARYPAVITRGSV